MTTIRIGGELIEPAAASVIKVEPGVFSVIAEGLSYEIRVSQNEATIGPHRFRFEIEDPRQWKPAHSGPAANAPAAIHAPMPGKVVRVLVAVGDLVAEGQGIVVVEAMKMQNEMKSPRAGRIAALKAVPNQNVAAGTVLALIEPV